MIERPGSFQATVSAVQSYTASQGTLYYYQSVADVTALIQANGSGPLRVSGIEAGFLPG